MEDSLVVYVTDDKPVRRLRLGAKADRFLVLGLTIPAILYILSSGWRLARAWPSTQWEDGARLVPAATIALALLLIGLALATWLRRTSSMMSWFVEQPSYPAEESADSPEEKAETSAA